MLFKGKYNGLASKFLEKAADQIGYEIMFWLKLAYHTGFQLEPAFQTGFQTSYQLVKGVYGSLSSLESLRIRILPRENTDPYTP